jgi:hypothetical protein
VNAWLLAILVAVGAAGGAWTTRLYYVHEIDQIKLKAEADAETDRLRVRSAAAQYETWKTAQRPRVAAAKAKTEDAIQADHECAATPLPDGLRDSLSQAAGPGAFAPRTVPPVH